MSQFATPDEIVEAFNLYDQATQVRIILLLAETPGFDAVLGKVEATLNAQADDIICGTRPIGGWTDE